jgi:hypothetical protein
MDIRPTGHLDPLTRLGVNGPRKSVPPPATDAADFSSADSIRDALAELPDSRPEVVDHGRSIVSQANYPPPETIKRISNLLAVNLARQDA